MNIMLRDALSQAVTELYKMGGEMPLMLRVDLLRYQVVKTREFYLSTLVRLVRSVYQGYIGGEFIDIVANLVQGQINQAYGQAWIDEGNGSTMPDYLTGAATEFIASQYMHVDQYYRDIVDARIDQTSIDPLLARADMWAGQYDTAYRDALLLIRTENGGNLVWRKGQTEQGCDTCARLDGLVMSAKDWDELGLHPRGYPNPQLACEGGGPANNCDCSLEPTDQRRSPKAKDTARDIVMGTRKHYGPGVHPGTGTSQDVHGGDAIDAINYAKSPDDLIGVDGVRYEQNLTPVAYRRDGVIVVGDKLFEIPAGERLSLIYHEIGHDVSRAVFSNNEYQAEILAALEPFRAFGSGVNSSYNNFAGISSKPEEFIADVYSVLMTSSSAPYEDSGSTYGRVYATVLKIAKREGIPTPDWNK